MYNAREQREILKELQELTSNDISKIEGTFQYDVLASNSIEFFKTEVEIAESYKQRFIDTSTGDFLTLNCAGSGTFRKPATHAVATVTVKGNGVLPKESLFATDSGLLFETTEEVFIKDTAEVIVRCAEAGTIGNVLAGAIKVIPSSIPGIQSVTNSNNASGGYREEDDEELRARALLHIRTPGRSGNRMHYYEWAMSVAGVGAARVLDADDLGGARNEVKVIITDNNYGEASETLCAAVKSYIDSVRTAGAIVTVVSAKPKLINITGTITGPLNKDNFMKDLQKYFDRFTKGEWLASKISVAKIGALLFANGATDFENLSINGGTNSIPISVTELAVVGEVNLK